MALNTLFDNTQTAFKLKSDSELERAYFLFKMISIEPLVRIGTAATNFALKAHLPVEGLIRSTVFDHFCGGVNEVDCIPKISEMYKSGVYSVLDYSVEGKVDEAQFDLALQKTLELITFSKNNKAMPIAVFKPTGFGRLKIYQKVSDKISLSASEKEEWYRIKKRFDLVCASGNLNKIKILIDAEESWIQPALDDLVEELMACYNKEEIMVYATIQLYLSERLPYLKSLLEKSKKEAYQIGVKLVRGAYIEKETARANLKQYANPVCSSKEATDCNFDQGLQLLLENLDQAAVFVGSHNEASTLKALEQMKQANIATNHPRVCFAHLYGMSDYISYNLSDQGYNVVKYLPYGPIKKVVPYLIRRAEENSSIANQTSREMELIRKEIKRRKHLQK